MRVPGLKLFVLLTFVAVHNVVSDGFDTCKHAKDRCRDHCGMQAKECDGQAACVKCPVHMGEDRWCWVIPAGCSPYQRFRGEQITPNGAVQPGSVGR